MKMSDREFNFKQPLLVEANDLMAELSGVRFVVVFPREQGWGQISPSDRDNRSDFCRIVQSTKDGAKCCRMCHILMTVSACAGGENEQRCHAGAYVFVQPVIIGADRELALVSGCTFAEVHGADGWKSAKARGARLGADLRKLKKAYYSLTAMTDEKIHLVRKLMNLAGAIMKELYAKFLLESKVSHNIVGKASSSRVVHMEVEKSLKTYLLNEGKDNVIPVRRRRSNVPLVIEVIADIVSRRPNMPFNVSEIAAAAKMTPNHFSTLFHKHMKMCFSDFLMEKRMHLAKQLLCDLTLNIAEVSSRVGYDDSGYFARKFKQLYKVTPREWRAKKSKTFHEDR